MTTQRGSGHGLSATQPRDVSVKRLSQDALAVTELRIRDLEHIASELRSIRKPRRWRGLLASILMGASVTALFAGLAGIYHATAPIPLRVGYFCAAGFCALFALVLYVIDKEEQENPMVVAQRVLAVMERTDMIAPSHPDSGTS